MKCIIAGSRTISDYNTIVKAIKSSGFIDEITEVVCGDAKGVDSLGATWAKNNKIPVVHMPADWKNLNVHPVSIGSNDFGKYNKLAGRNRNEEMGKYADCLIAVIKDNSTGTAHMIEVMKKLNKPFYVWEV